MSEFRIDKITNRDGSAGTQIAGISTFSGTSGMQLPVGQQSIVVEEEEEYFLVLHLMIQIV